MMSYGDQAAGPRGTDDAATGTADDERRELLRRVARAEAAVEESRAREAALGEALARSEADLAGDRASLTALRRELEERRAEAASGAESRALLEARLADAEQALSGVTRSVSWRITEPLRRSKRALDHPGR